MVNLVLWKEWLGDHAALNETKIGLRLAIQPMCKASLNYDV